MKKSDFLRDYSHTLCVSKCSSSIGTRMRYIYIPCQSVVGVSIAGWSVETAPDVQSEQACVGGVCMSGCVVETCLGCRRDLVQKKDKNQHHRDNVSRLPLHSLAGATSESVAATRRVLISLLIVSSKN